MNAQAAMVAGYNTNTYQSAPSTTSADVTRHPSPYTGLEGTFSFRLRGPPIGSQQGRDQTITLRARTSLYSSVLETQPLDYSFGAAYIGAFPVTPRTTLGLSMASLISSINGTRASDGTLAAIDPFATPASVYTQINGDAFLAHQIAEGTTYRQLLHVGVTGVIDQPGIPLSSGNLLHHKGIDAIALATETTFTREFTPRWRGAISARYDYYAALYVFDGSAQPPGNIGPEPGMAGSVNLQTGYTFSQTLTGNIRVGAAIIPPGRLELDQRVVVTPTVSADLFGTMNSDRLVWAINVARAWGSASPRIGAGVSTGGGFTLIGQPYVRGRFRNLYTVLAAGYNHSDIMVGAYENSEIHMINASVEARYGIGRNWGLFGGYDLRRTSFKMTDAPPPYFRQLVFFGLSYAWSTEGIDTPPLQMLTGPIRPG